MNFSSHCKQKFNKKVFSILCVSFVPYINFIKSNTVLYKFFEILNNYNNLFDNYLIIMWIFDNAIFTILIQMSIIIFYSYSLIKINFLQK